MRIKRFFSPTLLFAAVMFCNIVNAQQVDTLWLQKIDMNRFTQDWKLTPKALLALEKNPLRMSGKKFRNGLSTRTEGLIRFTLNGKAQTFYSLFGLDDASNKNSTVVLSVLADNKEVFRSPEMKRKSKPVEINIDLKGVKQLALVIDGNGLYNDKTDFANAFISYQESAPEAFNYNHIDKRHILTPAESPEPKINGAKVFGVRPGHPFMFTITATGKRPMSFAVENLPNGLSLDTKTGIITGVIKDRGETIVKLKATN